MKFTVIKPIITEVSMKDAYAGKFTFLVEKNATKPEIRKEIENLYSVKVTGITTVTIKSNRVIATRIGRRNVSKTVKKARVALQKGQTIPAFEIPEEGKKTKKKEDLPAGKTGKKEAQV